jgi:hypothetical protein
MSGDRLITMISLNGGFQTMGLMYIGCSVFNASYFLMKTTTDTESISTQLNRARLLTVIFPHNHHSLRTFASYEQEPYAAFVKVCASRGKPLPYSCSDSIIVCKMLPMKSIFHRPKGMDV